MPEMIDGKTYWLVGASQGLGEALARKLAGAGCKLILSARSEDALSTLADELGAEALPIDVTNELSVSNLPEFEHLDGVIYCVGTYDPMTAKGWETEKVHQMTAVNFGGAVNVLGKVLPGMLMRNKGHIALIGSLSGFRGLPGAIGYGASKAALMHLAENLRIDLTNTDILVQRLNPGFIKTRLTDKNDFDMPQIMTPEEAAEHVYKGMLSRRFSTSFPRPFAWLFTGGQHMPVSWFQSIFSPRD